MPTSFLALLSAYYLCDAAAMLQPLPPSTAQSCAAHYEAVKSVFGARTGDSPADRRSAYLRFKAWEAENADTVGRLREKAAESARRDLLGEAT
ncbi:MAG: hypothetical protein AAGG09_01075 [Pseudomonadota bacterium]